MWCPWGMTQDSFSHLDDLTAEALLAIDAQEPERLFTGDTDVSQKEFRHLARQWHPDFNTGKDAARVFAHVQDLFRAAKAKLAVGDWQIPGLLQLDGLDGKIRRVRYAKKCDLDGCFLYIARSVLVFLFAPENRDLFDAAVAALRGLSFADAAMRDSCARHLPTLRDYFETAQGPVLVYEKGPELVRLQDYIDYEGGRIDPRHAAWILSGMYHVACYLEWAGVAHNDISPASWFIHPTAHTGHLFGGWQFAARKGAPLRAVPPRAYDLLPQDVLASGRADPRSDLSLIRLCGREMLGDPAGLSFHRDPKIPAALSSWLRMPPSASAFQDYRAWFDHVLPESYGPRRYMPLEISFDDVYGVKGGTRPTMTASPSARPGSPHS